MIESTQREVIFDDSNESDSKQFELTTTPPKPWEVRVTYEGTTHLGITVDTVDDLDAAIEQIKKLGHQPIFEYGYVGSTTDNNTFNNDRARAKGIATLFLTSPKAKKLRSQYEAAI